MLFKLLQETNAQSPISETELPMVTLVRSPQRANAISPMVVTELGMLTLVRPLQEWNAILPMVVTEPGITEPLQPVINVLLAVSIMALQLSRESYFGLSLSTTMLVRLLQPTNG